MPTPANRAKIQLVRGSYANILASIEDLLDGELCYAKDRNRLYMVEGSILTPLEYLNTDDANEIVQDIIGLAVSGGTGLTASYNDVLGITVIDLDNTTVTPGTYGDANSVARFTVDQQGRITQASNVDIGLTSGSITDLADAIRETAGINQTFEPMGHAVRTDSIVSFNELTRTFSIQPAVTSYDVWCRGVKYTKTGVSSVTIPDVTGLYYIYFNATGVLEYRASYFNWDQDVPTSYVYWNADLNQAVYFADERHGITLDWATHEYLHRTRGAVIANGFSLSSFNTEGDGSLDSHCQIDVGGGTFFDEDLEINIVHSNTPIANSWQQKLSGPAQIPVFYQTGAAWTKDIATNFPLKQGTSRPQFNSYDSGTNTWSVVDAAANRYIVQFIVATHNLGAPVISIMGQAEYPNIGDAEAVAFEDLALPGFPSVEFRPLYKLVFQVGDYANNVNARLRSVVDIRNLSSAGAGQGLGSDHGALTGLGDDDHQQYLHVTEDRLNVTANILTSGTLKTSNTTGATSATTGAAVVAGGVGVGGDVYIGGNLTVEGYTVSLNTEVLLVEDKNIELGYVEVPTDVTANSGGITLLGTTNKTIQWLNATDAWTFSEHVDLAPTKEYRINGVSVLNSTTLGSGVTESSLTSVGTITTGTWNATEIAVTTGGTGLTSVPQGTVLVANASNTISALDGGGINDGYLLYDAATDTISWITELDGGTY